jgi:hypothetical protein
MQVTDQLYRTIKTAAVTADAEGNETRTLQQSAVDMPTLDLAIGKQYAFGAIDYDRVVLGKVVTLDASSVTFDFADATQGERVYIAVTLDRLRKACNQ